MLVSQTEVTCRLRTESDERITVISITPHPVLTEQNIRNRQKKSNLKQSTRFSDKSPSYQEYSAPSRNVRARETSDESNMEEYQIEGMESNLRKKNLRLLSQKVEIFHSWP